MEGRQSRIVSYVYLYTASTLSLSLSTSHVKGFAVITPTTTPFYRQFDFVSPPSGFNNGQQAFTQSLLVSQHPNAIDPSFIDCYYGVANSQQTVIEQCYYTIGCCQTTCCRNYAWEEKYGWAVALIVIFCILVLVAFAVWLVVWLINRSRDKRQKQKNMLIAQNGGDLSPSPSQLSIEGGGAVTQHGGYYPYVGGPKQTVRY